jgi:hypothetical protein
MLLLGVTHTAIGFYCRQFSEGTLWFIGSGIAVIFAGLFNMLMILAPSKQTRFITLAVNVAVAALFVLAMQVISGVQVYVGIGLFMGAALLCLFPKASVV